MPQALRCANTSRLRRETRLQRWFTKYAKYAKEEGIIIKCKFRENWYKCNFIENWYKMRGASNAKAKRELNFQPRPLEWMVNTAVAHAS
ncbi:hypothetical protein PQG02_33860 (plasmid) [Nostoc sp. UHCC 0926]|uniref:hypothetical protein n=1 Tax=Nostoc sp. UHCC 0926 TaxID=3025190 RepID=UPI002361D289|nr:hypothetical protein [Nostoc sp. UHCC 0926]WDD36834.1 hypothetical protein PQG02_33860 [Nostoc sp. UHCC 0926]